MVVPPDDGHRYTRNMYRLMKYIKNKLCIKLVFFYMIILPYLLHFPQNTVYLIIVSVSAHIILMIFIKYAIKCK